MGEIVLYSGGGSNELMHHISIIQKDLIIRISDIERQHSFYLHEVVNGLTKHHHEGWSVHL